MGLKKVFNLRRLTGINSRGAFEDGGSNKNTRDVTGKDAKHCIVAGEEMQQLKSGDEQVIAIVRGESESVDSRLQVYASPSGTMDESIKEETPPPIANGIADTSRVDEVVLQVYEIVDGKTDDVSSNDSAMGFSVEETAAFEILTVSSSKDYGSIFSGVVASDAGSVNKAENLSSADSTEACGSLITESGRSTKAVGPEIILVKNETLSRKHSLRKFFSVMTLLEGEGRKAGDGSDVATASATALEANSLEEKSIKSSSTITEETSNESESSSVAVALFAENHSSKSMKFKKSRSCVLPPSAASAQRDANKKVVTIMTDNFKKFAGNGACFCENVDSAADDLSYKQSDADIIGIFSRDVEDSDTRISCALNHDDTFTLDSMDGNRMYM